MRAAPLAWVFLLAFAWGLCTAGAQAQCVGCDATIPANLQILDCRENENGGPPTMANSAGGPGGTNVEIRHANLFQGGMTVTHVCIRLDSPTGQPGEPARVTFRNTDPNNSNLPGSVQYTENFVISPNVSGYQLVQMTATQSPGADFWLCVEYPTAMATVGHQYVSPRTQNDSALFIDAPTVEWDFYDDTNAMPYVGFAPVIRALELGPVPPEACCFPDGTCQDLFPVDCIAQGGTRQGANTSCAVVNCPPPGGCVPGSFFEPEACGSDSNGGCNTSPIAFTPMACGDIVCGTAWAQGLGRDTDWYEIDLPDVDGDGMAELTAELIADLPLVLYFFEPDCLNSPILAGGEADVGLDAIVTKCLPAPATYWVFVAPGDLNGGIFSGHPCGTGNDYILSLFCNEPCINPPPPNDDCATAPLLQCNTTTSGTTLNALPSGPNACGAASGLEGVWYEIVGADAQVDIDTCGSATDVHLALYIGSCGNLNCLASASTDTLGVCGGNPNAASLSFFAFSGVSYYLYVAPQSQQGDFELNVNCTLANDTCATAAPVVCGSVVSGDTTGVSNSGLPICGGIPNVAGDLWYHFVGNGGPVNAHLCDPGTTVNQFISVFTGSCGNLTCVDASFSDQLGLCAGNQLSSLQFQTNPGDDYFIVIHPNGPANSGPFTLTVDCPTVPNDDCANAQPVVPGVHPYDNCAATTSGPPEPCGFTGVPNDDRDIWFSFDMPCDGTWQVLLPPVGHEQLLAVYNGCPTAGGVSLGCDGPPLPVPAVLSGPGVAGEQFWVRVGARPGQCGPGMLDLTITCANPCPPDCVTNGTFQPPPDGNVDGADLAVLLGEWSPSACGTNCCTDTVTTGTFMPPPDGVVDGADLAVMLGAWGNPGCPSGFP